MPDYQDPNNEQNPSASLLSAIKSGTVGALEVELADTQGPLDKGTLVAVEQTQDLEKICLIFDYALLNGVEDARPNWLIWSLSENPPLKMMALMIAEMAVQSDLQELNVDGKTALDIARAIGASEIANQILETAEQLGIELGG